jgi:hypothetical protein
VREAGLVDWAMEDIVAHDLGLGPQVEGYMVDDSSVTGPLSSEEGYWVLRSN